MTDASMRQNTVVVFSLTTLAGILLMLLGAHPLWWGALVLWCAFSLIAAYCCADEEPRDVLVGALRTRRYTQLYLYLARRAVMWVWDRVCDPADDQDSLPRLFRAALAARLCNMALLIAVLYPLLLLSAQWIVTGKAMRIGSLEAFPRAAFWPDRMSLLCCFAILVAGHFLRMLAAANRQRLNKAIDWLFWFALTLALAFAFALAPALAFAFAFALAPAFALALTFALALAFAFTFEEVVKRGRMVAAMWAITAIVIGAVAVAYRAPPLGELPEVSRFLIIFLVVLPVINGLFDALSCAVTLSFIRRGLRSSKPWVWGVFDCLVAGVIFLALGAALIVVLRGMNILTGMSFVDLGAFLKGIEARPWGYVWVYLMLSSTMVPTALHIIIALIGLQGLCPGPIRRWMAGWIEAAPGNSGHTMRAVMAQGVIWTVPVVALCAIGWAAQHYLWDGVQYLLGWYWDLLYWIADVPVRLI